MEKTKSFLKTTVIAVFVALVAGFFLGVEYKGYKVEKAFQSFDEGVAQVFSEEYVGRKEVQPAVYRAEEKQKETSLKEAYIEDHLILDELEITKGYGILEFPGYDEAKDVIKGKIKNRGDKILAEVEITVYFLDKQGSRIFEEDYRPVFVSQYNLSGDNKPLKPNYVKEFGYILEDVPSEWSREVEVEITDIEFQEE